MWYLTEEQLAEGCWPLIFKADHARPSYMPLKEACYRAAMKGPASISGRTNRKIHPLLLRLPRRDDRDFDLERGWVPSNERIQSIRGRQASPSPRSRPALWCYCWGIWPSLPVMCFADFKGCKTRFYSENLLRPRGDEDQYPRRR